MQPVQRFFAGHRQPEAMRISGVMEGFRNTMFHARTAVALLLQFDSQFVV
jgi:hypothetical protein